MVIEFWFNRLAGKRVGSGGQFGSIGTVDRAGYQTAVFKVTGAPKTIAFRKGQPSECLPNYGYVGSKPVYTQTLTLVLKKETTYTSRTSATWPAFTQCKNPTEK
jgi:hypothetical protein